MDFLNRERLAHFLEHLDKLALLEVRLADREHDFDLRLIRLPAVQFARRADDQLIANVFLRPVRVSREHGFDDFCDEFGLVVHRELNILAVKSAHPHPHKGMEGED